MQPFCVRGIILRMHFPSLFSMKNPTMQRLREQNTVQPTLQPWTASPISHTLPLFRDQGKQTTGKSKQQISSLAHLRAQKRLSAHSADVQAYGDPATYSERDNGTCL